MNKIAILTSSFVAIAALLALLLYQGILRFNYPSFVQYPVQGIDVSHHQQRIDWLAVKSPQAQFAYIKASEGADFKDTDFASNWRGALAANIVPGAYHFFTLCKSGSQQATNFIASAGWSKRDGLPPAVDLEFGGNCNNRLSLQDFHRELQIFLTRIESEWGCQPVIYVTKDFYRSYAVASFRAHPFWVRDIYRQAQLEPDQRWRFWQFANRAHLHGIESYVDLNVFNGSQDEFAKFRCRHGE